MQTVRTVPLFFSVLFFYNSGHFFRCLCLLSEDGGMLSPERFSLWSSLISNPLPCVFPSLWSPDRYLSRTQVSRAPLCEQSVGKIFADHSQGSPVFSLFVSPEGSFILWSIWNKKKNPVFLLTQFLQACGNLTWILDWNRNLLGLSDVLNNFWFFFFGRNLLPFNNVLLKIQVGACFPIYQYREAHLYEAVEFNFVDGAVMYMKAGWTR